MPKGVPSAGYRMTRNRMATGFDPNAYVQQKQQPTLNIAPSTVVEPVNKQHFSINQRFDFIEKLVAMVATGIQPSAVITGKGGLGKTYTVIQALKKAGYRDVSSEDPDMCFSLTDSFRMVKGYSSPKGLYRSLYENINGVLVFDDTDAVLDNDVSLNILKAALDSYSSRIVSWNADLKDKDLPKSFEFNGRVIFISNRCQSSIDQAIRSRSMMVDLSMTNDEMIERMEFIASQPSFMPEIDFVVKQDAIDFLRENVDSVRDMSLRTLISIIKIRSSNADWKDFAKYIINEMPVAV
jgi:hypothetical protein